MRTPGKAGGPQRRRAIRLLTAAAASSIPVLQACGGGGGWQEFELPLVRLQAFWPPKDLRRTYVLRTEAQWQAAWEAHEPPVWPAMTRPAIDFQRTMVLGLTLGSGPNGCWGMAIRRVVEEATSLRVEYASSEPRPGALCTQAIVALTDFVAVPQSDKPVRFERVMLG